ncbi:hypothetical protein SAMN04487894_1408, partial [Niabella drilacis]
MLKQIGQPSARHFTLIPNIRHHLVRRHRLFWRAYCAGSKRVFVTVLFNKNACPANSRGHCDGDCGGVLYRDTYTLIHTK